MANIKSQERTAKKWARVASGAAGEYEEGVRNPRSSWSDAAQNAEPAYEQGIQQAISRKAYGKGVARAGDSTWQQNAIQKGPSRYSHGVSLAEERYKSGFAPYAQVIKETTLPPRGAKGDPKNFERVKAVALALHKKKLELSGGA